MAAVFESQRSLEQVQSRIYGPADQPVLVYLPGLHGDWTLVGSFRAALRARVRFVEFTYPRQVWRSLEDYACAICETLRAYEISSAWLLAESFGSQVAWSVIRRDPTLVKGVILAGGFVRYPYPALVTMARWINRNIPMSGLRLFLRFYASYARFRHRSAPETLRDVAEFVTRRSQPLDRETICGRYDLIAQADFREAVRQFERPVYHLYGFVDPIVPWFAVRRWLRQHCKLHRGSRMIWSADHNVLGTAPQESADQVVEWIAAHEDRPAADREKFRPKG